MPFLKTFFLIYRNSSEGFEPQSFFERLLEFLR